MNRFTPRLASRATILSILCLTVGFGTRVESSSDRRSDFKITAPETSTTAKRTEHTLSAMVVTPVLATLSVDTPADDATKTACTAAADDCSLRGAIISANSAPGTVISVPAGSYLLAIAGAGEQLAATGDIDVRGNNTSIVGAGAATTTIQQTIGDRVFDVNPTNIAGFSFSISGVTVSGGLLASGSGAGVLAGGPGSVVNVADCAFTNNRVNTSFLGNGGAISYVSSGAGDLTVSGSTFSGNVAAFGVGAGIRFSGTGTLTVENSSFTNNESTRNSGAAINATGPGAGGTYIIRRSSFSSNRALGATSRGGAIALGTGNLAVSFSRLVDNASGSGLGEEVSNSTGIANVESNWWGINTGPGGSDLFGATATVWLQLRHTANPATLCANGPSSLTANILGLNMGGPTLASTLVGLPAFPATFANAVNGTISGASAQFVDGIATATFTAGMSPGAASADATADHETQTANLTVEANDTSDLIDQTVCQGATANFSTTPTGNGPFSYAWTVDGAPFDGDNPSIMVPTGALSVGSHTVSVTVTGACNSVTQSATLTVQAPTTTTDPADVSVCQGAMANFSTTASGTGPFSYAWTLDGAPFNGNSPSITVDTTSLTPGMHTVVVTTTGTCGSASQSAILTVGGGDQVITLSQTTAKLWPPNHSYKTFNVTDFVSGVTSSCDSTVDVNDVVIASVTSDEPEENPDGADGNTLNDIVIAPDCKSVQLRAERDGNLNGRVYTITFKVTDSNGNVTTATVTVTAPKNHGGTAVDDGPSYTVSCP